MNKTFRKIAAGALAVLLTASLCGCDKGYLMTVDGTNIRNGLYILYMQSAYELARDKYDELNPEQDDEDKNTPITKKEIDGKNGSQWIKDETLKLVRRHIGVLRLCEERGIELTEEEIKDVNTSVNQTWDTSNEYISIIYGYNSLGEYYESMGIGKESMKEMTKFSKLHSKLFLSYYDKDGTLEVSEDEINNYLTENYVSAKILFVNYKDASGKAIEDKDKINELKKEAEKYAERINNGESPIEVFYEYSLKVAKESAAATAEEEYDENNEEGLSKEEWIKKEVDDTEVTKAEKLSDLDTVIGKESTGYDEKIIEHLFNAKISDKAEIVETDAASVIVIKSDITKMDEWKSKQNESILDQIKGEDFAALVDLISEKYETSIDTSLVNKKYAPETLNS